MKQYIILFLLLFTSLALQAQENEKVTYEHVKQACESLPLEKRVRVRVSHFTVATATDNSDNQVKQQNAATGFLLAALGKNKGNAPNNDDYQQKATLGDNLSDMLTNALFNVNCYRVLEQSNDSDQNKEIDKGDVSNKYSDKKTALKTGRMENAQILVKGEVIEYSIKEKGAKVLGVGSSKKMVKMGINLKMVNAETGDLITSRDIHVESQTGKDYSLGVIETKNNSDPAVAAVMEDCIVKGVEYLAKMRDSLQLTADGNFAGAVDPNAGTDTQITLSTVNFSSFSAFAGLLSSMPTYKALQKSLANGVGTYIVTHTGTTDTFVDDLSKKMGAKYEVTSVSGDNIEVKAK